MGQLIHGQYTTVQQRPLLQLTAGVWASVASGLVTPALGALAKEYPGLEIRTVELAPEATAEAVMDGSLDFSFVIDYMNYPMA